MGVLQHRIEASLNPLPLLLALFAAPEDVDGVPDHDDEELGGPA